jgi:hypothetical protein
VLRKNGKDDLLIALLAPKARHDSDNTPTNEKIALSVIEQCCRPEHGVFFREGGQVLTGPFMYEAQPRRSCARVDQLAGGTLRWDVELQVREKRGSWWWCSAAVQLIINMETGRVERAWVHLVLDIARVACRGRVAVPACTNS